MPTVQATRFTCPECGANLSADGNAAVGKCAYCGTSSRLQRRTKVMQRPIKLPPAKPEEPPRVARAHREWSLATIVANVGFALLPIGMLGVMATIFYLDWRNDHTVQWADIDAPRMLDVDGDGVDDVIGVAHLHGEPVIAAVSGKTGHALWHTALADTKNDPHSVVVAGGMIVAADLRGTMYGFTPRTGVQAWKSDLADEVRESCRNDGDAVLLVELHDDTWRRVDGATGAVSPYTPPSEFRCLAARGTSLEYVPSGAEVEDHPSVHVPTIGIASVLVRGTGLRIVAGEHAGGGRNVPRLAGVRADGSVAWEHDIASGDPRDLATGGPYALGLSDDAVAAMYHREDAHHAVHLAVFDRATGATRFDVEARSGKLGMAADYVAVGNNGCLQAFDTRTGRRRWELGCD
jgi:outer membrane protein assembly factor BamB